MNCKFLVNATALLVMSATSWAANDGATLYKQKCAGCHGANGEGKPAIKAPHRANSIDRARSALPL